MMFGISNNSSVSWPAQKKIKWKIPLLGLDPPLEVEKNKIIFFPETRPFFEHFLYKLYFHH